MSLSSELGIVGIIVLEFALVLGISPLLSGVIRKIKSRSQGRVGFPIFQSYRDLGKLFHKGSVYAESASAVTEWAPLISFGALIAAIPLVPWLVLPSPFGFAGDLILFVGLLALSRFMTALAALDAGSTFGGMGSTRDMWIGALLEPAFLLTIFAWGAPSGSTGASTIALHSISLGLANFSPPMLLATTAFVFVLFAETGRLPFDNPATHLELTMIHEAMVLDYSGRELLLIEWGKAVKFTLLTGLLLTVLLPWGLSLSLGILVLLAIAVVVAKLLGASVIIGALETRFAKLRLFRVVDFAAVATVLALGSISLTYLVGV
jgi:formate hydrogenlyase subunit 4